MLLRFCRLLMMKQGVVGRLFILDFRKWGGECRFVLRMNEGIGGIFEGFRPVFSRLFVYL